MNERFPISERLMLAINKLYPEQIFALGILGEPDGILIDAEDKHLRGLPLEVRLGYFKSLIEDWIENTAASAEEFNDQFETERLRNETTGMLCILREMLRFFPEGFDKKSET